MPEWSSLYSHGGLGGSPGEVAEWSKANDSKSFEGKPSVGSNPTLSVCTGSEGIRGYLKPFARFSVSASPEWA